MHSVVANNPSLAGSLPDYLEFPGSRPANTFAVVSPGYLPYIAYLCHDMYTTMAHTPPYTHVHVYAHLYTVCTKPAPLTAHYNDYYGVATKVGLYCT